MTIEVDLPRNWDGVIVSGSSQTSDTHSSIFHQQLCHKIIQHNHYYCSRIETKTSPRQHHNLVPKSTIEIPHKRINSSRGISPLITITSPPRSY